MTLSLSLTPEDTLKAYSLGLFPMAQSTDADHVDWIYPEMRGQLSITNLHIPKKLLRAVRKRPYKITVNTAFKTVVEHCAQSATDRPETWINNDILEVFCELHEQGHAHSVECWDRQRNLVGGLYGLAVGGTFCGESMFSRADNASKIALVHLTARLWSGGFTLLDTQFLNDHLMQFGAYEIPQEDYQEKLAQTLDSQTDFQQADKSPHEITEAYLLFRSAQAQNHPPVEKH